GGSKAIAVLQQIDNEKLRPLQGDALLMCADQLLHEGDNEESQPIYTQVMLGDYPKAVRIGAHRGFIQCSDPYIGAGLILTMLRNEDKAYHRAAGRFVADIVGENGTRVMSGRLEILSNGAQVILLNALGERGDKAALDDVTRLVMSEDELVSLAALEAMGDLGGAESVELLAQLATVGGVKGEAAYASLCRLSDGEVDDTILSSMRDAEPAVRLVLIRSMAGRVNTEAALMLLRMARFTNVDVRRESLRALGVLGGADEVAGLVGLLAGADDDGLLVEVERAIMSVGSRMEVTAVVSQALLSVLPQANVAERISVMRLFGRMGGAEALETLKEAVWNEDYTDQVRDEAIRSLATWEDAGPADVLLEVAQKSTVEMHQVLAIRGYIRMAGLRGVVSREKRQAMYEAAMKAAERAEEKRMVLGAVAALESRWALEFVAPYLTDEALKAEAEVAFERISDALSSIVGRARQAEIHGSGAMFEAGSNRNCIGSWSNVEAWVSWEVEVAQAGAYVVVVSQSSVSNEAGSEYVVAVGDRQLEGVVKSTGDWGRFEEVELGEIDVSRPGKYELAVRPIRKAHSYVMNLQSVILRRK
ncbi:MAG: HEAT repeat domain-containing protein, partial [Planctomycetes bacterium]|nr:HEAT repeat domain-containing protein [Planctomycetota bacterium]